MVFTIETFDLRDVFITERKILSISGFYPRRSTNFNCFYALRMVFCLLVSYGHILSMITEMVLNRHDLSKLSECLLYFITQVTFICKLMNFLFNKAKLLDIEDILAKPEFYGFTNQQFKYVAKEMTLVEFVAKQFRVSCAMVVLGYSAIFLLNYFELMELNVPGWNPWHANKFYIPTALLQILGIAISASNNSSMDIITWRLISVATAQLHILKDNLENIQYLEKSVSKQSFINCIRHHKSIIKFTSRIETMFSNGIFLQFFASTVVFCFTGFKLIVVTTNYERSIYIIYFACMLFQIAMYCWFGQDVTAASAEISRSCYLSNWYESDTKLRKSILIFMERVKKPVKITAGKIVTLDLATLTTILRSSYSAMAVLLRLYKE